jgi:CDP-glucose 4,6-dehydratase
VDFEAGAMEELVITGWENRRVFLSGHTGFKGSWLSLWLSSLKAQVRGFALDPSTEPSLFHALRLGELIDDHRGDIRDSQKLSQAMSDFAPEIVFHLAAQPLVRESYTDPVGTYMTNVIGTANLFEAVRRTPSVRAVIVITTDKCYRNNEWAWGYREIDPLGGYDPYSSSKACVELLAASYRSSYFMGAHGQRPVALATVRAGNVIGGGDWSADRLIPDLIRGFINDTPVHIRYPGAVRPWQHVIEPLAGYLLLGDKLLTGETGFDDAWNFGPSEEGTLTVGEMATALAERWGDGASWIQDSSSNPHEAGILRLDSSKSRTRLLWKPRLTIRRSLDWIVDWFRAWEQGDEMRTVTLDQIAAYSRMQ